MAIVNSIILGRAKGSIGNVTLSTQKGRVIAKQKATIVSNPNTPAQQEQRSKLSKGVLAWQAIGHLVKSGITAVLPFATQYNTYVSKNMDIFAINDFPNGEVRGLDLQNSFASIGRLGTLAPLLVSAGLEEVEVSFNSQAFKSIVKVGDIIKGIFTNTLSSESSFSSVVVDQAMWDAGGSSVNFEGLALASTTNIIAAIWVEYADGKESSTSKFLPLV